MEPMLVFLLSGTFSMSAAISTSKLLKRPAEERPGWLQTTASARNLLLLGNLFALLLVAAMWFGITHLTWWIPVACLFVTFPVIHVLILERLLGDVKGVLFCGTASVASALLLWLGW
ncbi:hypothetical protein [Motiliproteus sediminis]|uniref:hypothetical protein n=1 Tax=Motiliproteus sediminis TaxID=1468178 RepID=UPI001AF015CA|nr:hypothetical protein [Motiliproteus sediminis]